MNTGGGLNKVPNTEPLPPGSETFILQTQDKDPVTPITAPATSKVILSAKGVENAKKRLRAFSIQKKAPLSPIVVPKPISSGNTTVLIGKLSSVKVTPKVEDPEQKKLPKPPKPGTSRRSFQDSYTDLQKRTLAEIEDMKRKMELVELGIPLGLICPSSTSEKAMPTKAMPPIKSFLDPQKVDEIIREAKKAKMEGKEFKFNYQKLLPDYDNPFQRKKDEHDKERKSDRRRSEPEKDKDRRKSESDRYKYESRRHEHRKDDVKYKERDRDKSKATDKTRENVDNSKQKQDKAVDKETDVNLNDYLICDSWSLDNDDKNSITSPKNQEKSQSTETKVVEPSEQLKASIAKKKELLKTCAVDTPTKNIPVKIEKLQPVIDSFKFEIDPNDDEVLDIFDEDSDLEKFAHQKKMKTQSLYDATDNSVVDFNVISTKETSLDGLNDDTFLESVINEIKEDELSDDNSQDQGLVEYDISPNRDEESPRKSKRGSITPEIYESGRSQSEKSDYSEGYRSSDSFKTNESGYKSVESYRLSVEKELDDALQSNMSKSTVDSLETWSFVLKICQPLLFRHDKKKCYKETRIAPKIWYTENPKVCTCVKDRAIVYEELEMCKMSLVDRVYGCDQISDSAFPTQRNWYSRNGLNSTESNLIPLSNEWEAEDSQQALGPDPCASGSSGISGLSGLSGLSASTPQRKDEMSLDREYQRFMESVWPEGTDGKTETSRSTTPVRHEARKKKKEEEKEEEKRSKKIKLSSEGWSQESDMEEYDDKSKKIKIDKEKKKTRKRKHSSSSSVSSSLSDSDNSSIKKAKLLKKKALKKTKSKSAKRRRIGRKILKKLKEKQKKRKLDRESDEDDGKKDKKSKKKKQQKLKKKAQKKKKTKRSRSTSSSSSETSSDSDSESDSRSKKIKRNKTKNKISKKTKSSSSDSSRSEELFDVNILNNIKTERLTDDEKCQKLMEFSPRRQKPREIINVKELQSDFVGNIHIKKEIEESKKSDVIKVVVFDGGNIEHTVDGNVCKEKSESSQDSQEIPLPPITLSDPTQPDVPLDVSQVPTPEIPPGLPPYPQNVSLDQIPTTVPEVSQIPTPELASALPPYPRNVTPGPASDVSQVPTPKFSPVPASYPRNVDQIPGPDESNMSQCSSQESMCSVKEVPTYEKDESHLRPSSQNSNYSFNDVIASQSGLYSKEIEAERDEAYTYQAEASYEMYEQLAMAYQSDVASQPSDVGGSGSGGGGREQRIETVVRSRCGEIKCDWRAGDDDPHAPPARPSRWGLKPGEVNIVLTGAGAQFPSTTTAKKPQIYQIQSLANRMDNTGYDEAYMDMYGASDRLQYGDCFSSDFNINNNNTSVNIDIIVATDVTNTVNVTDTTDKTEPAARTSSLDARIDQALKDSILGEVAKDTETENDKDTPEKGILITGASDQRGSKRVSFADGYKPGQDSDVEDPPVKRRKKPRRIGCAWPCPAAHPDHVPLWDALPPPPAPPGSPPPPPAPAAPPAHLLRARVHPRRAAIALVPNALAHGAPKYDPTVSLPAFMPPEPPPGLITLQ